MGRTATVTFEQVTAIADAMKVEGINSPSTRTVRERLGNTGSMGTINKFLAEWKSGQKRQISAALVLPAALQGAILDFMDKELTSARTSLESDLAAQQLEVAELAAENERQCEENEEQADAIERLRADVAALLGRAGQLETDLVTSRDECVRERTAAESARTELAKAQLRLEAMPRLESDLAAAREVIDTERDRRQAAEQAAAVSAARLEALQTALQEAAKREQMALAEVSTVSASLDSVTKSLDLERTKRQLAEQAAAVSEANYLNTFKALESVTAKNIKLDEDCARFISDVNRATMQAQVNQNQIDTAARENEALKERILELKATLKESQTKTAEVVTVEAASTNVITKAVKKGE